MGDAPRRRPVDDAAPASSAVTTAVSAATAGIEVRPPWLRCENVAWILAASAAMVLFLAATASESLSLRLRIQKTGKRNLNWNMKPMRWVDRNVRRGACRLRGP